MRTDQLKIASTGIAVSQVVSAALVICGVIMYIKLSKKGKTDDMKGDNVEN